MLFKSYIIEKNISIVNQNLILFYGENIGLKNYFKYALKKNDDYESISFNQDEVIKNKKNRTKLRPLFFINISFDLIFQNINIKIYIKIPVIVLE